MKFLELLKLLVQLTPLVIEAIRVVESEIPGEGKGAQKLDLVRAMLESAYKAASDISQSFESIWPALKSVIDQMVAVFNKTGWPDRALRARDRN